MEIEQGGAGTGPNASTSRSEGLSQTDNGGSSAKMSPAPVAEQDGSNDADSDVSMSSESDSHGSDNSDAAEPPTDPEPRPTHNGTAENMTDAMDAASKKRKSPGGRSQDSEPGQVPTFEAHKRARLDNGPEKSSVSNGIVPDKSLLAPEVWHHIFTFCPPKTLGNLLSVNKLFHQYLNPSSSVHNDHTPPAPRGVLRVLKPHHIWLSSRRLFWPHMPAPLRSMGQLNMWRLLCSTKCQQCNKSPAPEGETPADNVHNGPGLEGVALIWVFGIRVCGSCLLGQAVKEIDVLLSSTVPSALIPALPFVYVTKELNVVSLSTVQQGQLPADVQVTKLFLASDVQEIKQEFISVKSLGSGTMEEWLKGLEARGQARLNESRKWEKWASTGSLQQIRQVTDPYATNGTIASQAMTTMAVPRTAGHHHAPAPARRTLEEVAELKAARRAEIERRASLLEPPLKPNVLRHMLSFQAATQLVAALDNNAWDLLKPRLLAERSDAEDIEGKVSAQIRMIQGQEKNSHLEATLATTKEARDAIDRDWEEVQAPLRGRIVRYADEFIRDSWDKGKKVKQENCSKFAAETLIHIRKRFYTQVAKDAEAAKADGREPITDPPEGPFTQKLTLENMRWIFDTKIKPLTSPLKKEVFFCNGCAAKPFGFEGVVQHYAAKHTDKLSSGNIVVHWRAEWPEEPPFNPEGRIKVVYSAPAPMPYPPDTVPSAAYPFSSYAQPPPPQVFAPGPPHGAAPSAEQYGYQYPGYPSNPSYAPPAAAVPPQSYGPPHPGWGPYQYGPAPNGPFPHNPTPPQAAGYQPPMAAALGPVPPPPAVSGSYNYGPGGYPGAGSGGYAPAQAPYPVQLEDIVRNSREIWNATANIRELPGSVRIFVTIYHVAKRFRARFSETAALAIFQDGLSNHKDMRPVRNINGLACKACQLGLGNAPYIQKDRDSFSLPQLVNHFQSKHVEEMLKEAPNSPPLDWTVDMILLPPPAAMANLPSLVGYDAFKYRLLSEAFPEVFGQAPSAPTASFYGQHAQHHGAYGHDSQDPAAAPPTAVDNHERFYPQHQGPRQNQGQEGSDPQHPYQQQPDYAQAHPANSYGQPHLQAPTYQLEQAPPNPMVSSVAEYDAPRLEENRNRASQGSRQRPQQNAKWARKERKRHAQNGHSAQNKHHGPKDEEPKLSDEEKAREEEMRAMWANDRAATARLFRTSDAEQPIQEAPKPNRTQPQLAARESRGGVKREPGESGPKRNDPPPREESSLLDALEMHLDMGYRPAAKSQPSPRGFQSEATGAPESVSRPAEQYPGPPVSHRRAVSPPGPYARSAREDYPQQPAADPRHLGHPYRPASASSRPNGEEARYDPRAPSHLPAQYHPAPAARHPDLQQSYDYGYRPEEQVVYDRPPPQERLSQDYRHRSAYPEDLIPPPPRGPPTGQLYEIVEVFDDQGSYFIRRPIGRALPPEPAYYDYPYEPERPPRERQPPVVSTGRGRGPETSYPPPRAAGEEAVGYSRPPLHRPLVVDEDRYDARAASSARPPWGSDYPPPPPRQHQHQRPPPAASRAEAAAPSRGGGGYDAEEYDPRYPAAPLPGPERGPPQYQRRQVRYD